MRYALFVPPFDELAPYEQAGATWWAVAFPLGVPADEVRGALRDGPPTNEPRAAAG